MSDDQAKEEAFINEHMGGGLLGVTPEIVHDYVQSEHQPPEVVNDIHTSTSDPAAGGWTGSDTAQVVHRHVIAARKSGETVRHAL